MQLNHVSILDSSYQLSYPPKEGAWCCTHGTGSKRCTKIRAVDNHHSKTTPVERARIDSLLPTLRDNPFALGLDDFIALAHEWVGANLCIYHSGPSVLREVRNEKLAELGWSKTEIETRSARMRMETEQRNPSRVGEGSYAITDPAFGTHSME